MVCLSDETLEITYCLPLLSSIIKLFACDCFFSVGSFSALFSGVNNCLSAELLQLPARGNAKRNAGLAFYLDVITHLTIRLT